MSSKICGGGFAERSVKCMPVSKGNNLSMYYFTMWSSMMLSFISHLDTEAACSLRASFHTTVFVERVNRKNCHKDVEVHSQFSCPQRMCIFTGIISVRTLREANDCACARIRSFRNCMYFSFKASFKYLFM